jgi:hypothetical protein
MKTNLDLLEQFEQGVLFERFLDDPNFFCKKMFGGLACYYDGKMVACLVEGDWDDTVWKGRDYGQPLWRGILIPTDFIYHQDLQKKLLGTFSHPVLKKWLYLHLDANEYDESAKKLIHLISRRDQMVGVEPKARPKKRKKLAQKR